LPPEALTDRGVVRRMLHESGVHPSKRLGQNFIVEPAVLDAFRAAVSEVKARRIVEIGPGLGAVTQVLAPLAPEVVAIEIDGRLANMLQRRLAGLPSVTVLHQDALDYVFPDDHDGTWVVGSIPYSITAPILQHLVTHRRSIAGAVLLLQREVAEKIAASPGPTGSALGVLVQAYSDVELLRRVSRGSFYPSPDVDSTLWTMRFLEGARFACDPGTFFTIVRAIYGARRKMLRAALRLVLPRAVVGEILDAARLDGSIRGETLDFAELSRLADALERAEWPTESTNP